MSACQDCQPPLDYAARSRYPYTCAVVHLRGLTVRRLLCALCGPVV